MTETEKLRSLVFQQLKRVCDKLITNLNQGNVEDLIKVVNAVPSDVFAQLSDYVLFPIQYHLYKYNTASTKIQTNSLLRLLQCLQLVIEKSVIESLDKFVNLNGLLLRLITDSEKQELSKNTSEDLKYEVMRCVRYLYESLDSNYNLLKKLYHCENKVNFHAQAVYACTQIARTEKMINLRIETMKCLLTIMRVHGDEYSVKAPRECEWYVAEIVASMFPGILSACYTIMVSDSTLHRDIYVFCIRVFCRSIKIICNDEGEVEPESSFKQMILGNRDCLEKVESSISNTIRTNNWRKSTTEKLSSLVHCLVSLCNNQQPKVRRELVTEVGLVLKSCSNLNATRTTLLHVMVILSLDQTEEVREGAENTLKCLLDQRLHGSAQNLRDLEESFFQSLDSVCSALSSVDENVLVSQLNLLNGLLRILNLEQLLKSSVYSDRLISVLVKLVRFDASTVNTFSVQKIQDLSDSLEDMTYVSWRNMKYLSNQTEKITKSIFATISQKVNLEFMSYHLLDTLESDATNRKEMIYLINNIILCERVREHEKRIPLVKTILDVYLDPQYWTVSIDETNEKHKSSTLAIFRNNLLLACLLTEGVGNMAQCLGLDFKPSLIHCLYLMVEKAGCDNKLLSAIGLTSLQKVTRACGYNHIIELMSDNIDFIMHRATLLLRHLHPNTKVFDVFCVMVAYSQQNSLSVLCDVIKSLLENDDIVQETFSAGFLRVFAMFVRRLRSWFVSTIEDECMLNESDDKLSETLIKLCRFYASREEPQSLVRKWIACFGKDELVDLEEIFRRTEYDFDDPPDEEPAKIDEEISDQASISHGSNDIKEEDKKIPQHIKLVITIVEKILHVLPHRNTSNKILIIEILIDSLLILLDHGEDQLLPIVHKIWSPLINRFEYDKTEALLMRRCFELLCVMAATAKDFLRSRTLKSVLPVINGFLLDSAKDSRLKDKKSVYRMSQRYKLQYTLLRQLGFLAVHLNFQENEIHNVLVCCTPYLSSKQPRPLQEACIHLIGTIEAEYRDLVKVYLLSLCVERSSFRSADSKEFRSINLKGTIDPNAIEYQKNVFELLEHKLPDYWSRSNG